MFSRVFALRFLIRRDVAAVPRIAYAPIRGAATPISRLRSHLESLPSTFLHFPSPLMRPNTLDSAAKRLGRMFWNSESGDWRADSVKSSIGGRESVF